MSNKTNLALDLTTFFVFLIITSHVLTGNTIHEWLAISFIGALIVHLLFHWDWLILVGGQFFKNLFHQSRLNFVINALFFLSMTGAFFSGLIISEDALPLLGIRLWNSGWGWRRIHELTSDLSVIVLGLHIALHWRWILTNLNRYLVQPIFVRFGKSPMTAQPMQEEENQGVN